MDYCYGARTSDRVVRSCSASVLTLRDYCREPLGSSEARTFARAPLSQRSFRDIDRSAVELSSALGLAHILASASNSGAEAKAR